MHQESGQHNLLPRGAEANGGHPTAVCDDVTIQSVNGLRNDIFCSIRDGNGSIEKTNYVRRCAATPDFRAARIFALSGVGQF